jgi:hypothetical protein
VSPAAPTSALIQFAMTASYSCVTSPMLQSSPPFFPGDRPFVRGKCGWLNGTAVSQAVRVNIQIGDLPLIQTTTGVTGLFASFASLPLDAGGNYSVAISHPWNTPIPSDWFVVTNLLLDPLFQSVSNFVGDVSVVTVNLYNPSIVPITGLAVAFNHWPSSFALLNVSALPSDLQPSSSVQVTITIQANATFSSSIQFLFTSTNGPPVTFTCSVTSVVRAAHLVSSVDVGNYLGS